SVLQCVSTLRNSVFTTDALWTVGWLEEKWRYRPKCFDEIEMKWTKCRVASGMEPTTGVFPQCCADLVCPDMKATHGLFDTNYYPAEVVADVCRYQDRFFKDGDHIVHTEPCVKWTCRAELKLVRVSRCQQIEEELGPYCAWETKNAKSPFPECCRQKVCRYSYPTHFPGTRVGPSPL
ncbi:hypothetical protein V5799_021980, partial [Amblyomma americanum]